jgi:hypothetical protein
LPGTPFGDFDRVIGAITMRLGKSRDFILKGVNSELVI